MDELKTREQEEDQYKIVFDLVSNEDEKDPQLKAKEILFHDLQTPMGNHLRDLFGAYERDRRTLEDRWLLDLRQYRGEYDPNILAQMDKNRSRAFLSLTRAKVKTISSRMTDLLMPVSSDKNWGIEITPVPDLSPEIVQNISQQYLAQTGQPLQQDDLQKMINAEAKARCERMEREMDDQLSELKYRDIVRKVILSGNQYGTGVLKGPMVKTSVSQRWLPNPQTGEWVNIKIERKLPYFEFVPIWDIYPDMTATKPEDMKGIFQRHTMPRHQVASLANRKDFNRRAILSYLSAYPDGDTEVKTHENELRNITRDDDTNTVDFTRGGKYEVLEFWGYFSSDELKREGVDIPEDSENKFFFANIWVIGTLIIKAVISSIEGAEFLYHFYFYDKDDTSLFGEGIPAVMRDPQRLFNAAIRAMLDNAAISAGPILEVNQELLAPDEDASKLYPFRVFVREGLGSDASSPAVRVYKIPSYTREYMDMINLFMQLTDEITAIPRYLYGDTNQVGGAGRTATGLSMLMGAANITLKDQVRNFDEGITKRFINALYHWNMRFNPKEEIKGDYQVIAKGSSSLIGKEVIVENLLKFMQVTSNPEDRIYTKRSNIYKLFAKSLDLDSYDVVEDQEVADQKLAAMAQQEQARQDKELELQMIKAKSGGHMNDGTGQRPTMESLSHSELQQGQIPEVRG